MDQETQEKSGTHITMWLAISWSTDHPVGGVFTSLDLALEWTSKSTRGRGGYYVEPYVLNRGEEE